MRRLIGYTPNAASCYAQDFTSARRTTAVADEGHICHRARQRLLIEVGARSDSRGRPCHLFGVLFNVLYVFSQFCPIVDWLHVKGSSSLFLSGPLRRRIQAMEKVDVACASVKDSYVDESVRIEVEVTQDKHAVL